ncbi:MAG: type II toxin-antitoxin system VapC family toxin [Candidatus Sericytochromatia bacterium]|nr:type II toxin-antitoxin system VapC family toxin [Candidatus Sericytochromatia bacterium]
MWLLDTNICSYILKHRPPSVLQRFSEVGAEHLATSTVVLGGLLFGCVRHPDGERIRREVEDFVSRLQIVPWDDAAARAYGDLRAHLERSGMPVGGMDLMIGAHALALAATLVTNHVRHFERMPGLQLENWV